MLCGMKEANCKNSEVNLQEKQANLPAVRMYFGLICGLPVLHVLAVKFPAKPQQVQHEHSDKIFPNVSSKVTQRIFCFKERVFGFLKLFQAYI